MRRILEVQSATMLNALLILPLALSAPLLSGDPESVFRDLSLEQAVEAASAEKKLVVLDAMTTWCAPCRQMELTTWRDPGLVRWLDERAVCIKLDMDVHTDVKQRLGIRGYPTLVAFRDGVAFDQVTGFKTAAEVRAWIEELQHGNADLRRLLKRVETFEAMRIEDINFEDRRAVAEGLLQYSQDEVVSGELLWLWEHIPTHAPLLAAWRWDVLPMEMKPLVDRVEAVRAAVSTKRLALRPVTNRLPSVTHLRDWIELNSILGDDAATAVFCGAAVEVKAGRTLMRKLDHRLFPLLVEQGDWRAAGLVLNDPIHDARQQLSSLSQSPEELSASPQIRSLDEPGAPSTDLSLLGGALVDPAAARALRIRRALEREVRQQLAQRYAALVASARDREAEKVAELLLGCLDDEASRIALVTQAIAAGVSQEHPERHVRWLDEATGR